MVNGLAIVSVGGPLVSSADWIDEYLGFVGLDDIENAVNQAAGDPRINGIMLAVDSPGGTVAGTSSAAAAIARAARIKPVHGYSANCACSGAYWLVSQCNRFTSGDTAAVGNVGVYAVLCDSTGMQQQLGLRLSLVSTAPYKGLGADGAVSDALIADVQREIADINQVFLAAVSRGRSLDSTKVLSVADGRAHIGQAAVSLGLSDGICSFEDACLALLKETGDAGSPLGPASAAPVKFAPDDDASEPMPDIDPLSRRSTQSPEAAALAEWQSDPSLRETWKTQERFTKWRTSTAGIAHAQRSQSRIAGTFR